jgi:hypothetical protein
MFYLKNLWVKLRYSGAKRLLFDGLGRIGIRITPYYLVLEGKFHQKFPLLEFGFDDYETGFLGLEDMKRIASIPGRKNMEAQYLERLKKGNLCFGVKYQGQLAAFTWCSLDKSTFRFRKIPLSNDEAYLFDAYTLMEFRGKGIAPFMRYQLYKELAKLGKNKLYSISDVMNTPSIKFKTKLHAKFIEKRVFVQLFKVCHFDVCLQDENVNSYKYG